MSSDTGAKSQGRGKAQTEAGKSDTGDADDKYKENSEKKPFYEEASCATLSFFDAEGERLDTLRFARVPEPGKRALKSQLSEAVAATLRYLQASGFHARECRAAKRQESVSCQK